MGRFFEGGRDSREKGSVNVVFEMAGKVLPLAKKFIVFRSDKSLFNPRPDRDDFDGNAPKLLASRADFQNLFIDSRLK
ncbi:hypothetical protein [Novipirellula artificiosorum]|uniref:hypothetical protein n=1 Tax=Novipirellula artificiosorum TaxID=2528016 RepID=UPI0011B42BC7|nr:hypothetical protein [Novipirellula artificiosorum]